MREFMLFIRGAENAVADLSPEAQKAHVEKIGAFIRQLMQEGKMLAAEPLEMDGVSVSYQNGKFIDGPFNETKEVVSGFYRIKARDLEEAVAIAKKDPRFEEGRWTIEVRPVLKVEGING